MNQARDDFVNIIGSLTNFVQNERVAAYNEAVDDMLNNVRAWLREHGREPKGKYLPELLDEVGSCFTKNAV